MMNYYEEEEVGPVGSKEIMKDLERLEREQEDQSNRTRSLSSLDKSNRTRSLSSLEQEIPQPFTNKDEEKIDITYSSSLFDKHGEPLPDDTDWGILAISPIPQRVGNSNIEIEPTINNAIALGQEYDYPSYPDDDDDDNTSSSKAISSANRSFSSCLPFTANSQHIQEDEKPLQLASCKDLKKGKGSSFSIRPKFCLAAVIILLIIIASVIVAVLTTGNNSVNQDTIPSSNTANQDSSDLNFEGETSPTQAPTLAVTTLPSISPSYNPNTAVIVTGGDRLERISQKLSWTDHQITANHLGCTLASVQNSQEQTWMENFFPGEQFWIGGKYNGNSWAWLDGTAMSYTNWSPESTTTGYLYDNTAVAMDTTTSNNYWIKAEKTQLMGAVYRCPVSFDYVMVNEIKTWEAHQESASQRNCSLASVTNRFEQIELEKLFAAYPENLVWIGAEQTGVAAMDWKWDDDKPFLYTNWQQGQPSYIQGGTIALGQAERGGTINGKFRSWIEVERETELMAVYRCP